jgi:5,10-methylene-tetrahydrofolate dehydrogenase/methenyl tetrahydrofolate cyclohydrolase
MSAEIIDGKAVAAALRARVGAHVAELDARHGVTPGLAVVLVGEDPASQSTSATRAARRRRRECAPSSIGSTPRLLRPSCWR